MKILTVFGTRPEAIKMAPVVLELKKHSDIESKVCVTGQHRDMLDQVMDIFGIKADYDLDIMKKGANGLVGITNVMLAGISEILAKEKFDIVLVHGDTTTSFAAGLAAFYAGVKIGHVEAGLRSGNIYSPFPEEFNRRAVDIFTDYYFAPTKLNKQNLLDEGVPANKIYITGNTVIDAMKTTIKENHEFVENVLNNLDSGKRLILLTAHRRENWGKPMQDIFSAVLDLANEYSDVEFVFPVHLNPTVRNLAHEVLGGNERIHLVEPVDVADMHNIMAKCYLVMTDSGGLQEEAPALGKPVIVLRMETERPEAVEAGTVKVVGVDKENILKETKKLLDDKIEYDKMAKAVSPYGDGRAAERILEALKNGSN